MKKQSHVIAEELVIDLEKSRIKKPPIHVGKIKGTHLGYDIKSGHRHIEVKSSGKEMTWKELTKHESKIYQSDSSYYIYLVEFDKKAKTADVYAIPKKDLKIMEKIKVKEVVRFSAFGNKEKRKAWLLRKGISYKKYE
jgi:hypothetical protein